MKIRYEDLVREPELETERMVNFLDIQEDRILLRPTQHAGREDWTGNSAYGKTYSSIEDSSVARWRSLLTPAQLLLLETLLGDEMLLHGYEPDSTPSTVRSLRALPHRLVNVARGYRDGRIRPVWNRPRPRQGSFHQ